MKDSKNLVIGMLCAVVCIMAVAYAAFSTTLTVTTTTTVDSNWCVKITEASCPTKQPVAGGAADSVTATAVPATDSLSATITMGFTQPGDTATCTVTYENCGTLNALVSHVVSKVVGDVATPIEPNEGGAIIYENAADSIRFTVNGAGSDTTLNAATQTTGAGTHTITIIGEYIDVEAGQGTASSNSAAIRIVSTAKQSV